MLGLKINMDVASMVKLVIIWLISSLMANICNLRFTWVRRQEARRSELNVQHDAVIDRVCCRRGHVRRVGMLGTRKRVA